jgi:hypothetical protein
VSGDKEIIGDAAKQFPVSIKLHQRMYATMKPVDMPLGIRGDASWLDQMPLPPAGGRNLQSARSSV